MLALLSQENGFVFVNQRWHFKALNQYSIAQEIWFRPSKDLKKFLESLKDSIQAFDTLQNNFIGNSHIQRRFFESFNSWLAFPKKWFCIRWLNLALKSIEPIFYGSEGSIGDFDSLPNNKEKDFGKCRGLPCFARKVVLYLLNKFCIFERCKNI